jgi:hypothetical protein
MEGPADVLKKLGVTGILTLPPEEGGVSQLLCDTDELWNTADRTTAPVVFVVPASGGKHTSRAPEVDQEGLDSCQLDAFLRVSERSLCRPLEEIAHACRRGRARASERGQYPTLARSKLLPD